MSFDEMQKAVA